MDCEFFQSKEGDIIFYIILLSTHILQYIGLNFSPIDAFDPDLKIYKKFSEARALEFDQLPGEMLLIPTGWFHQV